MIIHYVNSASTFIQWAKTHKHLKVSISNVPDNILPAGCVGKLYDVKVFTKHGPDDAIYNENSEIRRCVARGNCFLEIRDGPFKGFTCVIAALKKFTGGLGDDDDNDTEDEAIWLNYFMRDISQTHKVISLQKANGEAAHLSVCCLGEEQLIVGGSKNVHMIVRSHDDIDLYTDSRYWVARDVCHAIFDMLDKMSEDCKKSFLAYLANTKYTAVFELLNPNHQHVENLSHLTRPELMFIAWTRFDTYESSSLCSMPPDEAIEKARSFNLKTVEYSILTVEQLEERLEHIRNAYGYEGEVFYFVDSSKVVFGLLKKKTAWYILCRAIREKVRNSLVQNKKNPSSFSKSAHSNKITIRLKQIQKWLGFDDGYLQSWQSLGVNFMKWCITQQDEGRINVEDISNLFPIIWNRYLVTSHSTDKFDGTFQKQSISFIKK